MDKQTVEIHGKEYETVASRVSRFREDHSEWSIITDIHSLDEKTVVIKASILNDKGVVRATGFAEEKRASSGINSSSALENGETSAIGRALACLGYLGTEFCSADELANALKNQSQPAQGTKPSKPTPITGEQKVEIYNYLSALGIENIATLPKDPDYDKITSYLLKQKINSVEDLDSETAKLLIQRLNKKHEEKLNNESE